MTDGMTDLNADALSRAIHARELSCREVMLAYLARIHRLNPALNAIVNLADDDSLLAQADERDAELARGASRGWMHGLPQAIKDTGHAQGFPTTYGCTLLKGAVATQDSVMTARMKAAGAIIVGKTNMPEFGLGSHTFNDLFGATPNAWDARVSAGGSSGGAAVALAQRLLPVADGSDFMGSLRNPAAWANIFGLRPSQGRVPYWPAADVWVSQLATEGPMARSVVDLARLLAVQAGHDARVPLSLEGTLDGLPFAAGAGALGDVAAGDNSAGNGSSGYQPGAGASSPLRGLRVAWLGDLGGHLAMEDGLLQACTNGLARMAGAGAVVEPATLTFNLDRLWQAWLVWRRALVGPRVAALLGRPGARDVIKPEALWEHDQAQGLGYMDFMRASEVRTAYHACLLGLFEHYDVLALPVTQVWPFAIAERWPQQIAGRTMDTYHRWMEVTLYATFAGLPGMSVPAGFHANGRWPAGLQLIGKPRGDAELLRVAAGYETLITDWLAQRPPEPAGA
ncbi:MAG: amidase [Burkholderiales bacterium]|nr:amidase [Burkholderiales bacterium]